mmetsp:Transcript_15393/g.26967  ORF Transcript_15393/g.26967 Transcript_15393/m.26967 type:complete len:1033 (+) Transcript_15393:189-3287(+)|eukprot:CAMPEP_0184696250 /NCGR_PEP_ID=MMETSP0313-20130426/3606_1 /TAXON_ID=2792 /ORGANISM="Porphyridium aerugineum, Strain SAG 1380-2" /LENGTH=1032 /DNA_ID=CAMNT_0027154837 /DNA_START=99 /DNA_END=3197 /DNA_ORIENTATION=+
MYGRGMGPPMGAPMNMRAPGANMMPMNMNMMQPGMPPQGTNMMMPGSIMPNQNMRMMQAQNPMAMNRMMGAQVAPMAPVAVVAAPAVPNAPPKAVDITGHGPAGGQARLGANGLLLPPEMPEFDKPKNEALEYIQNLNPKEGVAYGELWMEAAKGDTKLQGKDAVTFFQRAKDLGRSQLRLIWGLADHEKKGYVNKEEFFVALRLVGLAQRGADLSLSGLRNFKGIQLLPVILPPSAVPPPAIPSAEAATPGGASVPGAAGGAKANPALWQVSREQFAEYENLFKQVDTARHGHIDGKQAVAFFSVSQLPRNTLRKIWALADVTKDGKLDVNEFRNAFHLVFLLREGKVTEQQLPDHLTVNGPYWVRPAETVGELVPLPDEDGLAPGQALFVPPENEEFAVPGGAPTPGMMMTGQLQQPGMMHQQGMMANQQLPPPQQQGQGMVPQQQQQPGMMMPGQPQQPMGNQQQPQPPPPQMVPGQQQLPQGITPGQQQMMMNNAALQMQQRMNPGMPGDMKNMQQGQPPTQTVPNQGMTPDQQQQMMMMNMNMAAQGGQQKLPTNPQGMMPQQRGQMNPMMNQAPPNQQTQPGQMSQMPMQSQLHPQQMRNPTAVQQQQPQHLPPQQAGLYQQYPQNPAAFQNQQNMMAMMQGGQQVPGGMGMFAGGAGSGTADKRFDFGSMDPVEFSSDSDSSSDTQSNSGSDSGSESLSSDGGKGDYWGGDPKAPQLSKQPPPPPSQQQSMSTRPQPPQGSPLSPPDTNQRPQGPGGAPLPDRPRQQIQNPRAAHQAITPDYSYPSANQASVPPLTAPHAQPQAPAAAAPLPPHPQAPAPAHPVDHSSMVGGRPAAQRMPMTAGGTFEELGFEDDFKYPETEVPAPQMVDTSMFMKNPPTNSRANPQAGANGSPNMMNPSMVQGANQRMNPGATLGMNPQQQYMNPQQQYMNLQQQYVNPQQQYVNMAQMPMPPQNNYGGFDPRVQQPVPQAARANMQPPAPPPVAPMQAAPPRDDNPFDVSSFEEPPRPEVKPDDDDDLAGWVF